MKVTPIAVSLTRLSAIATRRKSMFGAPKKFAAIRQGQAGGGCGAGRRGSWRKALPA